MTDPERLKLRLDALKCSMGVFDEVLDFMEFLRGRRESIDSSVMLTIEMKYDSWRGQRNEIAAHMNGIREAMGDDAPKDESTEEAA
jgi:hypothetical protein